MGTPDKADKAIVFSQWTSMLDLLEGPLRAAGLDFRRLDGTMSVAAREKALSDFEEQVCGGPPYPTPSHPPRRDASRYERRCSLSTVHACCVYPCTP